MLTRLASEVTERRLVAVMLLQMEFNILDSGYMACKFALFACAACERMSRYRVVLTLD